MNNFILKIKLECYEIVNKFKLENLINGIRRLIPFMIKYINENNKNKNTFIN